LLTINDSFFASWLNSKDQIVVKVAMLLTLANNENFNLQLERPALEEAITLIDETEKHFPRIFSGAGRNPIAALAAKMLAIVSDAREPLLVKKLKYLVRDHGRNEEIQEALDNLKEDEQIHIENWIDTDTKSIVPLVGTPEVMKDFLASKS